jgi:hypothetical protein
VDLLNKTLLARNSAPRGSGRTIHLAAPGVLRYTLPAPPGRWLNIRQGIVFPLDPGAEELDLPYGAQHPANCVAL